MQQRGEGRGPACPSPLPCVSEGHRGTTERDADVCTVRPDNLHVLLLLKPRLRMWWNPKESFRVHGKVAALGPGLGQHVNSRPGGRPGREKMWSHRGGQHSSKARHGQCPGGRNGP